jgi:hypothetical protein
VQGAVAAEERVSGFSVVSAVSAAAFGLSRNRHRDLRRFSLARIIRYLASAGYDIEVHLKKTPRLEPRPEQRRSTSTVVRYDYYGRVIASG